MLTYLICQSRVFSSSNRSSRGFLLMILSSSVTYATGGVVFSDSPNTNWDGRWLKSEGKSRSFHLIIEEGQGWSFVYYLIKLPYN